MIHKAISGSYYKQRTETLRSISDPQQARKFKAACFDYCTFSGVFTTRNNRQLLQHSGLLTVDFDHLTEVEPLRQALLDDEYFETRLLFVSPSGNGLKWIIPVDIEKIMPGCPVTDLQEQCPQQTNLPDRIAIAHRQYFMAVANYIRQTYRIEIDKSGRDVSRACFLTYDPNAYINPKINDNDKENIHSATMADN